MTIYDDSEFKDYQLELESFGYSIDDFELTSQEDPPPSHGMHITTGTVTVKHHVSGKERTYQAGHATAWVAEFANDLKDKAFSS